MKKFKNLKLIEKALKTIRHYEMLKPGDRVLAAVSGGPDSVFLLHALNHLKKKLDIELFACNLDHGLRGEESRADSSFVAGLSKKLGIRLVQEKADLLNRKDRNLSTEESARLVRYGFFRNAARRLGANVVATGHTLDDQAETVLMRLIKGSSSKGVCGIPPVRDESAGLRVIRPLIELEKDEVLGYLNDNSIDFCIDSTNLEDIYFRNIVRRDIVPFLERFNPRLKLALSNFAGHLREDMEFIRAETAKRPKGTLTDKTGVLRLNLKDIAVQPRALMKEIMRDALEASGADMKKLSYKHWKAIENFIRYKRKGSFIDLPGGIRIARKEKTLDIFRLKT